MVLFDSRFVVPAYGVPSRRTGDSDRSTSCPAKDGREVTITPILREPVEHRSNELHQRCFPGLIRAVKQGHLVIERLNRKPGPDTEPIDLYVFDSHPRCLPSVTPPRNHSTPTLVAFFNASLNSDSGRLTRREVIAAWSGGD